MQNVVEIGSPGNPIELARYGIRLPVHVGKAASGEHPHELIALVDTGAPLPYYVDIERAAELGLRRIDGPDVTTRSLYGTDSHPAYLAGISIDKLGVHVPTARLVGFDIKKLDAGLDFIIGRHFLRNFIVSYDGVTGSVKAFSVS